MTTDPADFLLRGARQRRGVDVETIAQLVDLPLTLYTALEADDAELWTAIDLRVLLALGRRLGVAPLDLLEGASDIGEARALTALPLLLRQVLERRHMRPAAFASKCGWPADDILHDPARVWTWTAEQFVEVCEAAGIEWRQFFGHQVPRDGEGGRR